MCRLHKHQEKVKYFCKWCRRAFMKCRKMFEHQSVCEWKLTNQEIEEKAAAEKKQRLKAILDRRMKKVSKNKGVGCCSRTPPTPPPPTGDAFEV